MANFPTQSIRYAEVSPSGRTPDVSAPAPPAGAGLAALGEALGGLGAKIQDANDAMELSELTRKDEEAQFARLSALDALTDPTDEEAIAQINQQFTNTLEANTSKRTNVNQELIRARNESTPDWDFRFDGKLQQRRAEHAAARMNVEYNTALSKGDVAKAAEILEMGLQTHILAKPEYDAYMANMPVDMAIETARINIEMGLYGQAILALDGLKGLNETQAKKVAALRRIAEETQSEASDSVQRQVLEGMFDNGGKRYIEKVELTGEYREALAKVKDGISPERYGSLLNQIQNWTEDASATTDWYYFSEYLEPKVQSYRGDPDEKIELMALLSEARFGKNPRLGQNEYKLLRSSLEKTDFGIDAEYEKLAELRIKDATIGQPGLLGGLAVGQQRDYISAMAALQLSIREKKLTGAAIEEEAERIAAMYRKSESERMQENIESMKAASEEMKESEGRSGFSPMQRIRERVRKITGK